MANYKGNPKPQYEGMTEEEKQKAYWRNSYEKHKEKRRAEGRLQSKRYREENREVVLEKKLDQWLRLNFKKSSAWYDHVLIQQGGHCALCNNVPSGRRFQVDHDHNCCRTDNTHRKTCGKCTRGLLCEKCNTTLGYLEQTLRDALVFPMLGKSDSWTARALKYIIHYERKMPCSDSVITEA